MPKPKCKDRTGAYAYSACFVYEDGVHRCMSPGAHGTPAPPTHHKCDCGHQWADVKWPNAMSAPDKFPVADVRAKWAELLALMDMDAPSALLIRLFVQDLDRLRRD